MSKPIGAKEAALRVQREQKAKEQKAKPLTKSQQMMVDDGLPPALVREGGSPKLGKPRKPNDGVTLAAPLAVQKAIAKDLADDPDIPGLPGDVGPADDRGEAAMAAHEAVNDPAPADDSLPELTIADSAPKPKAKKAKKQKAGDGPAAATKERTKVRTKTEKKASKAKARTPVKAKTSPAKGERSPLAVGEFIVKNSPTMDQLSKRFGIDPHPMRSKVFAARHELGFKIEHKDGRYSGTAPKAAKKA